MTINNVKGNRRKWPYEHYKGDAFGVIKSYSHKGAQFCRVFIE